MLKYLFIFNINSAKLIKSSELAEYAQKTLDSSYKGAVFSFLGEVLYMNKVNQHSFSYKICKEQLFTVQIVFYYKKYFYLVESINGLFGRLKEAGLLHFWISKYIDYKYINIREPRTGPKIMNVYELMGILEIWFMGILLSSFVFVVEWIWFSYNLRYLSSNKETQLSAANT